MRILILTPRLPWPPRDGGRVAMARLAESLAAAGARLEIVSLNPKKQRGVAGGPVPIQAVDVDTSRRAVPLMRALSGGPPYVVSRFVSGAFRDLIRDTIARFQPDLVQIESPFLLPYAPRIRTQTRAPVVLRSLNVEFRIWEGLAEGESNALRRFALRRVAESVRRYELARMHEVDAIVPISDGDAAEFRRLGITRPMHVVPCGVVLGEVDAPRAEPGFVGFLGSLDYRPNQQAVERILDELWPRIAERAPAARLTIAGSSPPEWLLRKARDRGVDILADVPDARELMLRMSVFIAPVFAGGGMRIKVLEAMALGKPVVATTIGAGGLEVRHGHDILIADDPDAFANDVARLLRSPHEAARLGSAARTTVAERYDADVLARGLVRFYESLLAR
jgi:glycosyltransferase involved in cell wall biosynthesis